MKVFICHQKMFIQGQAEKYHDHHFLTLKKQILRKKV